MRRFLPSRPASRAAFLIVVVLLLVAGVVLTRVWLASRAAFERAEGLEAEGENGLAALSYREAITWYFPGNDHVTRAIERMWSLADEARSAGDLVGARIIIGDLRASLFAIRTFYQPHRHELKLANERLARLLAETDERVRGGVLGPEAVLPRYQEAVALDHAPSVPWSLALGVGFLLWIATSLVAIVRLVPADGTADPLRWRSAAPWLAAAVLSLVVWLAGAALA